MSRRTFKALRCHRAQCGGGTLKNRKDKKSKKNDSQKKLTFLKHPVQWLKKHKEVPVGMFMLAAVAVAVAVKSAADPNIKKDSKVYVWMPTVEHEQHNRGHEYKWVPAIVKKIISEPYNPNYKKYTLEPDTEDVFTPVQSYQSQNNTTYIEHRFMLSHSIILDGAEFPGDFGDDPDRVLARSTRAG